MLRQYRKQDFESHLEIVGDDDVMRFIGGSGLKREDGWRRFAAAVGSWPLLGFGGWAVVRRSDNKLIGMLSLFNAWRDMEPQFGEEPEMGWIFAKEVHGQGIAAEACLAALAWADEALGPVPVWAIVAPENAPSLKLAERLGFERLADSVYNEETTAVLR
ncbi:MAG: GNAT family N-acetyltransferase, partial [Sphingomonas sp.]|nr:GNAT family N-acetyltransferase [Sphingomonas sp.]